MGISNKTAVGLMVALGLAGFLVYQLVDREVFSSQPRATHRTSTSVEATITGPGQDTVAASTASTRTQALVDFLNANSPNNATYRTEYDVTNVFGDRGAALFVSFSDHPDAMRELEQAGRVAPGTFCELVWSMYEKCNGNVCLDDVVRDAGVVLVGVEGVSKTCTF